jgi:hypothetical protein
MVAKYFVAVRSGTNDLHLIHKEECPFLPEYKRRIYLGELKSNQEAIAESHRFFVETMDCLFCCKQVKESIDKGITPKSSAVKIGNFNLEEHESNQQVLICCLN